MGSTVFPAPAAVQDNWQLITSSTPTSGSAISFTSISTAWRKLWVQTETKITLTGTGYTHLQVDSLTGATDYQWFGTTGTTFRQHDEIGIYFYTAADQTTQACNIYLVNPSTSVPFLEFYGQGSGGTTGHDYKYGYVYNQTSPISSLTITTTNTFDASNTGVIKLYGTY